MWANNTVSDATAHVYMALAQKYVESHHVHTGYCYLHAQEQGNRPSQRLRLWLVIAPNLRKCDSTYIPSDVCSYLDNQ